MAPFGERLKYLRVTRKVKVADLAALLDVSTRQLNRYERDEQEPSLAQLVQIARFYHVSADYLLGLTDRE